MRERTAHAFEQVRRLVTHTAEQLTLLTERGIDGHNYIGHNYTVEQLTLLSGAGDRWGCWALVALIYL